MKRPGPGPEHLVNRGGYEWWELAVFEFCFLLTLGVVLWAIATR